jgi:hypothetical protein
MYGYSNVSGWLRDGYDLGVGLVHLAPDSTACTLANGVPLRNRMKRELGA